MRMGIGNYCLYNIVARTSMVHMVDYADGGGGGGVGSSADGRLRDITHHVQWPCWRGTHLSRGGWTQNCQKGVFFSGKAHQNCVETLKDRDAALFGPGAMGSSWDIIS